MLFPFALAASLLALASAGPLDHSDLLSERQSSSSSSACSGNTASTRSEWCDYSTDTDYYEEAPDTGVTREFWVSDVNHSTGWVFFFFGH